MSYTTVQLERSLVKQLNAIKKYPRQTYNEVILFLVVNSKQRTQGQYDDFLHSIQQKKMAELWDNPADEVWENV
jgi:hypothetical protein